MSRIKMPMKDRRCFNCGSATTYRQKNGTFDWANIEGKPWCKTCVLRIKYNPISTKKWNPIQNKNNLRYKNKQHILKERPRTGFCNICKKRVGDEYINCKGEIAKIKQTQIHHINYHDTDILKDTIELCASCHRKISGKKIELILI